MKKTYTIDLSEYGVEERVRVTCFAVDKDAEWECVLELDLDDYSLSKAEVKAIRLALREQFEQDMQRAYGVTQFHWKGDRKSPLLNLKKGDRLTFIGGEGEVLYVVPDKFGIKTPDGRVLNFSFKSLEHFLFKKL